jgi:hypothetical protein
LNTPRSPIPSRTSIWCVPAAEGVYRAICARGVVLCPGRLILVQKNNLISDLDAAIFPKGLKFLNVVRSSDPVLCCFSPPRLAVLFLTALLCCFSPPPCCAASHRRLAVLLLTAALLCCFSPPPCCAASHRRLAVLLLTAALLCCFSPPPCCAASHRRLAVLFLTAALLMLDHQDPHLKDHVPASLSHVQVTSK